MGNLKICEYFNLNHNGIQDFGVCSSTLKKKYDMLIKEGMVSIY